MLSYMILFYCWTWCQTAKRITREIKSIPTLFTSLSNVIPPFVALTLIETYGLRWEYEQAFRRPYVSVLVLRSFSLPRPLDPANRHFITTEMRGQVATQRSLVVALPPRWHPPHYPAEGMLGNWNRAKWAAVQHVRLSMGFHYPKQKHRVMLNNRFPSVSPQSNDSTLSLTWTWFSLEQP